MKSIFIKLSIILTLLFTQCSQNKEAPFLFRYSWNDTIINYKIYKDSLIISFPNKTKAAKWQLEAWLHIHSLIDVERDILYLPPETYFVINNKINIPLKITDTININSLRLSIFAKPFDGLHFTKDRAGYYLEGNIKYYGDTILKAVDYIKQGEWYIIPFSLLEGSDSIYYYEKTNKFLKDSLSKSLKKFKRKDN